MTTQAALPESLAQIDRAFGVRAGRNSRPDPVPAKREVKVATRAARQSLELLEMRRALNAVADRELCTLIAAAEAALLKVQYAAYDRAVMVRA